MLGDAMAFRRTRRAPAELAQPKRTDLRDPRMPHRAPHWEALGAKKGPSLASRLSLLDAPDGEIAPAPVKPVADAPSDVRPVIEADRIAKALRSGQKADVPANMFLDDEQGARCEGAKIVGFLNLRLLKFSNPINFIDCQFDDAIDLSDAHVESIHLRKSTLKALVASSLRTAGDLNLVGCTVELGIDLIDAHIGGSVFADKIKLGDGEKPVDSEVLDCHRADIGASILVRAAKIFGQVDVSYATVGIGVSFDGTTLMVATPKSVASLKGTALRAARFSISDDGQPFTANGCVEAVNAEIRQNLNCIGSRLSGGLDILGARIGGVFNCARAKFASTVDLALCADSIDVRGSVFLRGGFEAQGEVDFTHASIGGSLQCFGSSFSNIEGFGAAPVAMRLRSTKINKGLYFSPPMDGDQHADAKHIPAAAKITGDVMLVGASVEEVTIPPKASLASGNYQLDGFRYERIGTPDKANRGKAALLAWLSKQSAADLRDRFKAQPWMQLVSVLRKAGYESDARDIAIEFERRRAKSLSPLPWLFSQFLRFSVLYGYSPWRPLAWSVAFVLFGWLVFDAADHFSYIAPLDSNVMVSGNWEKQHRLPAMYPPFNSFVYALDVYLPISGLGEKDKWYPVNAPVAFGGAAGHPVETTLSKVGLYRDAAVNQWIAARLKQGWHRGIMWFEMLLGWVFSAVFIAGITGIVKRQ